MHKFCKPFPVRAHRHLYLCHYLEQLPADLSLQMKNVKYYHFTTDTLAQIKIHSISISLQLTQFFYSSLPFFKIYFGKSFNLRVRQSNEFN